MPLLTPDVFYPHITDIPGRFFKERGLKLAVLDVDNTLTSHNNPTPFPGVAEWIAARQAEGVILCILSNNSPGRVKPFAQKLRLPFVANAAKPLPGGWRKPVSGMGWSGGRAASSATSCLPICWRQTSSPAGRRCWWSRGRRKPMAFSRSSGSGRSRSSGGISGRRKTADRRIPFKLALRFLYPVPDRVFCLSSPFHLRFCRFWLRFCISPCGESAFMLNLKCKEKTSADLKEGYLCILKQIVWVRFNRPITVRPVRSISAAA